MSQYLNIFRVQKGPDAHGQYRVYEVNGLRVIGSALDQEVAREFALQLNEAFSKFVNASGHLNYYPF